MTEAPLSLTATQRAWLDEIGVDLHWLAADPVPQAGAACLDEVPTGGQRTGAAPARMPDVTPRGLGPAARVPDGADPAVPAAAADCADLSALLRALQAHAAHTAPALADRIVAGWGVADRPAYCIVGEQPGLEDEAPGRPFQGDPGRLLQAMLAAVRLPQAQSAWFTLVVKQRTAGGRPPADADILGYLPYLRQEIALVRPHCLLALGQVAARALLGSETGFDALRGGPHSYAVAPGVVIPVWVTHHPASLLVRSAWKADAWRDLLALAHALRAA